MKWLRLTLLLLAITASAQGMLAGWRLPPSAPATRHEHLFAAFHENITNGNLVPLWSQHLRHGFGGPDLEFHPPMPEYVAEAFLVLTGNAKRALGLTGALFVALAGVGLFLLARRVPGCRHTAMPCLTAGAYVLNPWFLGAAYAGTGYENLAALALLPWLALNLLELLGDGNARAFPRAALVFAALACANTTLTVLALPFVVLIAIIYYENLSGILQYFGALVVGAMAAAFHWVPVLGEHGFVKVAELASAPRYVPLLALLTAGGALGVLGLSWGLLRWSGTSPALAWHRGTKQIWKLALTLLIFTLTSGYFTHRLSAVWHGLIPAAATPDSVLPLYLFFATLLGGIALFKECNRSWQWVGFGAVICGAGALTLHATPANLNIETFVSNGLAESSQTPSTAGLLPAATADAALTFALGRGEGKCQRRGPTQLDCEIMAVHKSTIRFGVLDYPSWHAVVDGKAATQPGRDALSGTLMLTLLPGKHLVHWQLDDTRLRAISKWLSLFAWLALLSLLFKNELNKRKALAPESV